MNRETAIQNAILIALSQAGCTVWRNETAGAWVGRTIHRDQSTITLAEPRMIKAGLCVGSADIVGVASGGRFLAIEVKTATGRTTKEQDNFLQAVRNAGGLAGVARSVDEALAIVSGN